MTTDYPAVLARVDQLIEQGLLSERDHHRLRWQLLKCMKDSGANQVNRLLPDPEVDEIRDPFGRQFCRIPAASFMMGEEDIYAETLAPVYIAKMVSPRPTPSSSSGRRSTACN